MDKLDLILQKLDSIENQGNLTQKYHHCFDAHLDWQWMYLQMLQLENQIQEIKQQCKICTHNCNYKA